MCAWQGGRWPGWGATVQAGRGDVAGLSSRQLATATWRQQQRSVDDMAALSQRGEHHMWPPASPTTTTTTKQKRRRK